MIRRPKARNGFRRNEAVRFSKEVLVLGLTDSAPTAFFELVSAGDDVIAITK
jgi:hypothetical protein